MLFGLAACLSVLYLLLVIQGTVTSPLSKDRYTNTVSRKNNPGSSSGEQLTIVTTVDGNIHGIDQAGNKLWSASTGGPMVGAHNFESSLTDSTAARTGSTSDENVRTDRLLGMAPAATRNRKNYAVLPGTEGSIIYHSLDGMRKTSVNARLLAEQAPFISREGLAFSGNKKSRLMSFDVNSGELLFDTDASEQTGAVLRNRQRSLADSDKQSSPLWFGRVDYSVRAVDTLTGLEEFNITYSELHPLPYGVGAGTAGGEGEGEVVLDTQDMYADEEERRLDDYKYRLEEATHTALEDVEIVGLLGSGAGAGSDDAEEPAAAEDNTGGGSSSGASSKRSRIGKLGNVGRKKEGSGKRLASTKKASLQGSSAGAGTGVGGTRKARRKRKSRVRMERRAGLLEELYQVDAVQSAPDASQLSSAAAPASSATVALISTPDGELYFSDLDGTVIEKVPVSLQSPVINAFNIKRRAPIQQLHNQHSLPSPASLPSPKRTPASRVAWDIRDINVHHRILTYAPTSALTALTTGNAAGSASSHHAQSTAQTSASIVVQSSAPQSAVHGESTSLYVLEVTDLEMPGVYVPDAQPDSRGAGQHLLPQPDSVPLISFPTATTAALSSPSSVLTRRSGGKYTKKELLSSAEERRRLGLVRTIRGMDAHVEVSNWDDERRVTVGQRSGAVDVTKGSRTRDEDVVADPDECCAAPGHTSSFLLGVDAVSPNRYRFEGDLTLAEEASLMSEMKTSIAEAERAAAAEWADRVDRGETLPAHAPVPPYMRGSHSLREDVYDGLLFSPDEHMNIFGGVPSQPGRHTQQQQQQLSRSQYQISAADELPISGESPRNPVVAGPLSPRARLERFASKVWAIVEVALLYVAALLVFVAITFVATVFVVRVSPALSHLLPAQESFSFQLQYALQALAGRIAALLVPAVPAPSPMLRTGKSLSSSSLPSVAQLRSPLRPSEYVPTSGSHDSTSSDSTTTVAETSAAPLSTAPVFLSPAELPKRTEEIVGAGRALPAESFDSEGRRLVHVGSLVVHSERVLGYGSHGTVVYRGSLHGRPLAVKRILSQFVRSADREISLLIRSDGHPNVVRYYTKEVQNDFVYLGLQLCDMTLKDFVLTVKSKTAPNKAILNQDCEDGVSPQGQKDVPETSISDALKGSLLQIAHGLAHLHSQRIVHRDIKPHNILCASPRDFLAGDGDGAEGGEDQTGAASTIADLSSYVLKISDMGLSKQLGRENFSFSSMSLSMAAMSSSAFDERANPSSRASGAESASEQARAAAMMQAAAVGTVGWQAPELISHRYAKKEPFSPFATDESNESAPGLLDEEPATPFSDVLAGAQDETADSDGEDVDVLQEGVADSTAPGSAAALKLSIPQLHQQQYQQRDRKKRTLTVDVFSLGCVFYFTITLGEHPYGEWFEREANIAAGKVDLSLVGHDLLAVDLISWMLHADPLLRPTSKEVCQHAFFWSSAKKLDFLVEFSDRLEQEPADSEVVLALEAGTLDVIGSRWDRRLDVLLLEDLGKYRKYDTSSVRDLLRVMRNKRHHFHELSAELKAAMGSIPGGFLSYFEDRFPRLVLHCAQVVNTYLPAEHLFKQWAACISSVYRPKRPVPTPTDLKSEPSPVEAIESTAVVHTLNGAPGTRVSEVVVWQGSAIATSLQYTGWWRSSADWVGGTDAGNKKGPRPSHLSKAAADPKYRTRLCSHWENSLASNCPMRKKGKCIFAHGALELRVRENRRDKWGSHRHGSASAAEGAPLSPATMCLSGGEDVLGAARVADKNQAVADSVLDSADIVGITGGAGSNAHASEFYPSASWHTQNTGQQYPPRGNTTGTHSTGRGGGRGAGRVNVNGAAGAGTTPPALASPSGGYYAQYPAAQLYQAQLAPAQQYAHGGHDAAHYYYQQQQMYNQQMRTQQQGQFQQHHGSPNVTAPYVNFVPDDPSQRSSSAYYSHT